MVKDHYPYEKWLFHWEYTLFSDKPIYSLSMIYNDSIINDLYITIYIYIIRNSIGIIMDK